MPGSKIIASKLNAKLKECVNSGFDQQQTEKIMINYMNKFSEYGAADSEPRSFLRLVLNKIYKEN